MFKLLRFLVPKLWIGIDATELTKDTYTKDEIIALTKDLLDQKKVDAIVQERALREVRTKFGDYEDLKKFKTEHEKNLEAATQKELEAKKEYEKLKEGWTKKEADYQTLIQKKDSEITDMKVGGALMTEIVKQNAYAEETMAIIKSQAVFNPTDGSIKVKGKDANGVEILHSVEDGVKKFLETRPHLVKVAPKAGGGTGGGAGGAGAGAGAGADDLNTLNADLLAAMTAGDVKKTQELTGKIRAVLAARGIKH